MRLKMEKSKPPKQYIPVVPENALPAFLALIAGVTWVELDATQNSNTKHFNLLAGRVSIDDVNTEMDMKEKGENG